ncbi:6965_t:CDS:2, partial [Rhizophagus irregularis]
VYLGALRWKCHLFTFISSILSLKPIVIEINFLLWVYLGVLRILIDWTFSSKTFSGKA